MNVLTFILFLLIAALCAVMAEYMMPNKLPGGIVAGAIIGVLGAWIGGGLIGCFGPSFAGVSLFPTFIGSAVLIFGCTLLSRQLIG
jgi:uncharacterized membrane protein YeaQ/YmgE (transglycosylase-associated protein family)